MGFGDVRALVLESNMVAHGVDVVVTLPGAAAVETTGIWLTPVTEDFPSSGDFARREPRRVMALSRAELPSVPKGTVIVAPEFEGGDEQYWRVDGHERTEADQVRVIVVAISEAEA
jgi:hypothetical protein